MSDWEERFERRPVRTSVGFGVVAVLGLVAVAGVGSAGFWALNLMSQPARVLTKTFDADNMIYNYEWFKQQYQDIAAIGVKSDNAAVALKSFEASAGERSTWTFEDKQRDAQLASIALGLANQRASMIADYNARSQMANRSIFKTGDLPAQIQ
jgi:hypothetical protein